jgi:hypothetical protein
MVTLRDLINPHHCLEKVCPQRRVSSINVALGSLQLTVTKKLGLTFYGHSLLNQTPRKSVSELMSCQLHTRLLAVLFQPKLHAGNTQGTPMLVQKEVFTFG